ncbi:MAG: hypothetical protein JXM70_10380, partial [Pirellulales bacterium]|nr:hypothetical protein [Pirellulales bacterium]
MPCKTTPILITTVLSALLGMVNALADAPANNGPPRKGLKLHLQADKGVDTRDGHVVRWRDLSPAGHVLVPAAGCKGPRLDAQKAEVVFDADSRMQIPKYILPVDARELTVLAVARADEPLSVSLLGIRQGNTPLVQLDVDEFTAARFIVRDKSGKTLSATTPAVLGARTVFGGVLSSTTTNSIELSGTAQVFFGPK